MSLRPVGIVAALISAAQLVAASDLQTFTNVHLLEHPANDGDSFVVRAGERQLHLRLYFVDCPESVATTDADAKRVREQAQYFGIAEPRKVFAYGQAAKTFTVTALQQPFTIHTAFASALGRTPGSRIYAFVTTADGRDLARELVSAGLARVYGTRRAGPDQRSADTIHRELMSLELDAMQRRAGIWEATDPAALEKLRAEAARERAELREILAESAGKRPPPPASVDINHATTRELQVISGIGPALAERIIAGRPYRSVDDLLRVNGMGVRLLERIRPYLTCTPPPPPKSPPPTP